MARGNNPLLSKLSGNLGDFSVAQVDGKAVLRTRPATSGAQSPAQSKQRAVFGSLAQTWKGTLTPAQQNGWLLLGAQMSDSKSRALSGFQAFMTVNGTLTALGSAYVLDAPAAPTPPAPLPAVLMLQASRTSKGVFSLTISSPAYTGRVLISGAKAVLPGRDSLSANAFKTLGVVASLSASTDVTALYTSRFGVPMAGVKIPLRLTPLTDAGFRGIGRVVTGVVTAVGAEETGSDSVLKAA